MQQVDLHPDESVTAAARWLASNPVRQTALLPEMRTRFGITTSECIEAIRIANTIRAAEYMGGAHDASPEKEKAGTGNTPAGLERNTVPANYQHETSAATDFASRIVARRHRLSLPVAKLVCELALIGGRAA